MTQVDTLISDQSVRDEAMQVNESFIVQAPAGSGKTTLLVQRFLRLLCTVESSPEECLAITFTRKAAAEMRDRILEALQRVISSSVDETQTDQLARQVLARDRQAGWHLLENPHRLKIQTIDAFCSYLIQQTPVVSRFGSALRVTEDPKELYRCAAKQLISAVETQSPWAASVKKLLSHLDNNIELVITLLASLLPNRDQWLPYIGSALQQASVKSILESGLRAVVLEQLSALVANAPQALPDFFLLAEYASKHAEWEMFATLQGKWPGGAQDVLPLWQKVADWLLTQEGEWRKSVTEKQGFPPVARATHSVEKETFQAMKKNMKILLDDLHGYPHFHRALRDIRGCPPPHYTETQWDLIKVFVELLSVLTAELTLVFQDSGEVDFTEITLAALEALGNFEDPSDLALVLDYKIKHILVDEFQDTSFAQFRLLEKLTMGWQPKEDRTLFLVGDPMQSIYRFRQAEVGLFLRCQEKGINDIHLKPLYLTSNFRSDPEVIAWTNAYFQEKFPKDDDINTGAIAFHTSQATQLPGKAKVSVHTVEVETEGAKTVELVREICQDDPEASIAILVRSRTHLANILPQLRQANITCHGIDLERLSDRPLVCDLLSLTKALLHLGDRIAWLSLLRGPWIHFNLKDLWIIANWYDDKPLWQALKEYTSIEGLSGSACSDLERIVPILSAALSQKQRLPLCDWILETWVALGGPQKLPDANAPEDLEAFMSVLSTLDWHELEEGYLDQQIERLYAKSHTVASAQLQIMTVHKAKGLEFDAVIVPGVGRRGLSDPNQLLVWAEKVGWESANLLVGPLQAVGAEPDPIYTYLRKQEKQKADHELVRLNYVAATRARRRLCWLVHE